MSRMLSSKYGKPSSHGPCHSYFLGFLGSDSLGQFWNPRLSMDWCKICKEHLEERIVVTLKIPEIYRAPDPVSILRSSTSATFSLSFSLFVDGDIAPLGTPPRRVPSYLANAKNLRPTIQKLETQALILRPQKRKMSAAWYMGDISIVYRVYRYCRLKLITEGHNCCIHFVSRSSKTRKPAMKILTEYPVKWRSTQ